MDLALEIERRRELATPWLDYATDGDAGRGESDETYRLITEERDFGKGYSSCGDLAHWLLFRLGIRLPWINRKEHEGWAMGKNISRLAWCHEAQVPGALVDPREGRMPLLLAGDVVLVWNRNDGTDAHALVTRHLSLGNRTVLQSADYGQPGGKRCLRELRESSRGVWMLGTRRVQRVISLAAVVSSANRAGRLVEPEDPPREELPTLLS